MEIEFKAFEYLNNIYKVLCMEHDMLQENLKTEKIQYTCGFFNNHSVKLKDEFVTEYYPIPVISIQNVGDIGIDIHNTWFEAVVSRQTALDFDYDKLIGTYDIDLYGTENFLCDLYHKNDTSEDIIRKIEASGETHFCILFTFMKNMTFKELLEILHLFNRKAE